VQSILGQAVQHLAHDPRAIALQKSSGSGQDLGLCALGVDLEKVHVG
jgi:hypothetical protein